MMTAYRTRQWFTVALNRAELCRMPAKERGGTMARAGFRGVKVHTKLLFFPATFFVGTLLLALARVMNSASGIAALMV